MLEYFDIISTKSLVFNTSEIFVNNISSKLDDTHINLRRIVVGQSEQGRSIHGFIAGRGDKCVALLGGAHSDEPVGPQMLRLLVESFLAKKGDTEPLFDRFTFLILPHINPDGEAENWKWIKKWPEIKAFATHVFREEPGRDLEFGYPDMRIENKAVAKILSEFAPFHLYINFHGMAFAEGIMLLIERHWTDRTGQLQADFKSLADKHKLPLHDHDRKGEKGFQYIGPGFTTTPEGRAMTKHFKKQGDEETASKFHLSSMEYIRSLGGDPLCLVTELPLYLIGAPLIDNTEPGVPNAYNAFREKLPELRRRAITEEPLAPVLKNFEIKALSPAIAAKIQLQVIKYALKQLESY